MKKDRNTFFQEAQMYNQTTYPNFNLANTPNTFQSYANQGFYAGPINNNPNMNYNPNPEYNSNYSDIESRLSKIERQLNRLDMRLNKLETNSFYSTDDLDNTTNVYMV